ncbi:hypothetical protein ABZ471_21130 [Streptomyces sp. NPDC005728]|uniref:hypothetical protein n=1 Tax=Streptomyces sp. NPDC005728 TaxID=3157054 RepID=UPI0033E451D1
MGSEQAGRRGIARLLAVCAVLLGLSLMHGAPATAASGCHEAAAQTAPMPAGHDAAAMITAGGPAATQHAQTAVQAAGTSGTHGTLCVSTPAQERIPLPSAGLVAVVAVAMLAAWALAPLRAATGRTRRRGPPAGGSELLLQVCIART